MASASNILNLPFRRSHAVSLAAAIKQYISTKYEQHPDMFTRDLETVEVLRTQAVSVHEPHASGIQRLQEYAAQLVWMGGKFPIDVGVDFVWYPAIGYNLDTPMSQNNIRFELANILFNLAALYCQLAVAANRSTADGLKMASNYFCSGAGVLSHLRSSVVPDMRSAAPEDMDPMTLECLERLMLAQAQECFWQKAVKDGMKDATISKLAAKVSDLYMEAGDFGIKSDCISSEWIHHMNAKHHHFAAAAQFRAACDCLEKRKYGEEVARLRDSLACVNEGLKEARYLNKIVLGDLNGLKAKVQDDLQRAEKDNDVIYLIPVPPKSELKTLDRASMVSSKVPKEVQDPISMLGDGGALGKPLFSKLVPYSVHIAASIYVNRRDKAIGNIVDELESLTNRIHDLLRSLNLPGSLQALEKPLGLPPGLVSHAEDIRQHNGPARLHRAMEDVDRLKNHDRKIFEEGLSLLRSEATEDEEARRKYGTDRWSRLTSQEAGNSLYAKSKEIEGYLSKASSSDNSVREKLRPNESLIRLLNGTDRELEDYVPSSRRATITPTVEREVNNLRTALNNINKLEARRRRKIEQLKAKAQADDINQDLLKEAGRLEREYPMQRIEAVQFEPLFDERLKNYDVDQRIPEEEEREQQQLLSKLASTNTAFTSARRGDTSTKDREQALQRLENAYFAYKEIIQNLDVGRKFYNDLDAHVARFRDDCRAFAYNRRNEAAQIANDIHMSLPMASLSISQPAEVTPRRSARHAQQQQQQQQTPLAAPKPVKPPMPPPVTTVTDPIAVSAATQASPASAMPAAGMWTPEMPIRFGGGGNTTGGAEGNKAAKDGRWDPSKGVNFG